MKSFPIFLFVTALLSMSIASPIQAAEPRIVVIFGDSITEGGALPPKDRQQSWANRVVAKTKGQWTVVNEGKGGRPTNSVKEFEAMLKRNPKAHTLIIALGTNDSRDITDQCVPKAVANIRAMVAMARDAWGKDLTVWLVGPPNIRKDALGPTKPIANERDAKLRELGTGFEALAKELGCNFLSLYGVIPESSLTKDGVHPDAAGNEPIAEAVLAKLTEKSATLDWIQPSKDGTHFVSAASGKRFVAWGVNYDHDDDGRLLEDYWDKEWQTVMEDFEEMRAMGVNVVRIHLQVARFMKTPTEANPAALKKLSQLLKLAEEKGLYLDVTGLGCYHKKDVPEWYDGLDESARWEVQAMFWEAIARVCAKSPAVFCYDLMNEPIVGGGKGEKDWLAGELAGMYFVQRLTLDPAGRTPEQVFKAWVAKLVGAIRKVDSRHMITVGEIPWVLPFPGAKPLLTKESAPGLDFVSVHFYPKKGEIDKALKALVAYDLGKPLVIEEMFPLECNIEEMDAFIEGSRKIADGWVSFYWGRSIEDYEKSKPDARGAIIRDWLKYYRTKSPKMLAP